MILCGPECHPVCDFCIYINKLPQDYDGGTSFCRIRARYVSWTDSCHKYHCMKAKEETIPEANIRLQAAVDITEKAHELSINQLFEAHETISQLKYALSEISKWSEEIGGYANLDEYDWRWQGIREIQRKIYNRVDDILREKQ